MKTVNIVIPVELEDNSDAEEEVIKEVMKELCDRDKTYRVVTVERWVTNARKISDIVYVYFTKWEYA